MEQNQAFDYEVDVTVLMKEYGLNLNQLAELCGVSRSMMGRVRNGKRMLSGNNLFVLLLNIAEKFNIQGSSEDIAEVKALVNSLQKESSMP